jgi:anti-sigma factor RsiW
MCDVDAKELSALSDGELSAKRAAALRAHADGCAQCQRALADLEALKRGLQALPSVEGEDNWSLLVNRLAQPEPPRRWTLPLKWALPSLALGALCASGGAALVRWHGHRGLSTDSVIAQAESEFRGADSQYRSAVERLRQVTADTQRSWPPPRRAEYEAAELQLEAAVERCRQIATERPADVDAEELLFAAYQKQIRFFEDAMMRDGK